MICWQRGAIFGHCRRRGQRSPRSRAQWRSRAEPCRHSAEREPCLLRVPFDRRESSRARSSGARRACGSRGGAGVTRVPASGSAPTCIRRHAADDPIGISDRMSSTDEIVYVPLMFGYSNYARAGFRQPSPALCECAARLVAARRIGARRCRTRAVGAPTGSRGRRRAGARDRQRPRRNAALYARPAASPAMARPGLRAK